MTVASQVLLGIGVVVCSVVIQTAFIEVAARSLQKKYGPHPKEPVGFMRFVFTLSAVTLWLLAGLLVTVGIWVLLFIEVGVFQSVEESFYFSLVSFTTLGFGDIVLTQDWRILAGFVATDGFLLFGLNTAILLEVIFRMRGHSLSK